MAILAELVAWSHTPGAVRGGIEAGPFVEAVDPVCGMTVPVPGARFAAEHAGTTYWFCSPGCRVRFVSEPDRYATMAPETAER